MDVSAVEARVARLVRTQCGVVTTRQLLDAGLTPAQVSRRVERRQLRRLHKGVYAVAEPALLANAAEAAALLAVGPKAVLSHRSAAAQWSLAKRHATAVDVLIAGHAARARDGITLHRVASLDDRDVTTRNNLRLTTPARTLVDFATSGSLVEVEDALSEARALKLVTDVKLEAALSRVPATHAGAAKIRAVLGHYSGRVMTRSMRERVMLSLMEAAGLPKPLVNVKVQGYEPDFYWPEFKLAVEFDGFGTHGSRRAFESDRRRDQVLAAIGIQTIRATWLQLEREPIALAVRIGQAIALRRAAAGA